MLRYKLFTFFLVLVLSNPVNGIEKSVIFTVDMNKLLKLSDFGKNIVNENNVARKVLQNENEMLESELLLEEKTLSELRRKLSVEDFQLKAVEFDTKVTNIRDEQSQKEKSLKNKIRKEEANFYKTIYPLLYQLMSERGGLVLIDQRNIALWDSSIDITDDAIEAINKVFGKATISIGEEAD